MSRISYENSTQRPLAAGETYTGTWDSWPDEHVMYNVISDVPGTVYIDFGIPEPLSEGSEVDWTIRTTFTSDQPVLAAAAKFRSLVKGVGRAFRVRYVNGSSPQTYFNLLATTGDNLFPASSSTDGEVLTTTTPQERNKFAALSRTNVTASSHIVLVDLSAQDRTGRVDFSALYLSIDRQAAATGSLAIGVISRVDGTSADVIYVQGVSFNNSDERNIIRDRNYAPSQLKMGVSGGNTTQVIGQKTSGITAINTATPLDSTTGTANVTPAVGDIILTYNVTAGTYSFTVGAFYHGEDTA